MTNVDNDVLSVELEDLRDEISFLKRAYATAAGLCFPSRFHKHLKELNYQTYYRVTVPLSGSDMLILDTCIETNGNFRLEISDCTGNRLWQGVWRDAA